MLGSVCRAILRLGPSAFFRYFTPAPDTNDVRRRHNRHLVDLRKLRSMEIYNRSTIGLIWIYNLLPYHVVRHSTVKDLQSALHRLLKNVAISGYEDWHSLFSPRGHIYNHPLLST